MITNYFITGDCHGDFSRLKTYEDTILNDTQTAIIILGDAGFNFWGAAHDNRTKNKITNISKCTFYCVKGNHDMRPESLSNFIYEFDENVNGYVYYQSKWPTIRYFQQWGTYTINGYKTLVIGGAYSVDKYYRLKGRPENTTEWTGWFTDEQMSAAEKEECLHFLNQTHYDFDLVLTHTCPYDWRPIDLFLSVVDQTTVDNSQEQFLMAVRHKISYKTWLFGHYHADRLERPRVQQFYRNIENLKDVMQRWEKVDDFEIALLGKSPFYEEG